MAAVEGAYEAPSHLGDTFFSGVAACEHPRLF